MTKRSSDLEQVRLFVANLLNEEQNAHSKLISALQAVAGKTREYEDIVKVLTEIYDAKIEVLEKIYRKIQSI